MRIFIVEDHRMFRDVLRKACEDFGHTVVGATESGTEAIQLVEQLKPEVVVLDLSLPDIDGFTVIERLAGTISGVRFLVLSSHCDDYTLFRVERAAVHGYVDKNTNTVETLRDALTAIASGHIYFSATFQEARLSRQRDPQSFTKVLSERERAILSLIGQGLSDEEIAVQLELSARTVQVHRGNIMHKLGLRGTPKLIAFAIEHGFTQIPAKHGTLPIYT